MECEKNAANGGMHDFAFFTLRHDYERTVELHYCLYCGYEKFLVITHGLHEIVKEVPIK